MLNLLFLASFSFFLTSKALAVYVPDNYRSGKEICSEGSQPGEFNRWISVPIDYRVPEAGTTDLYFWTMRPYDTQKNTIIFVSGGPGDTAHKSHLDLPDWNVVFFDQRGNSCSRPASKKVYLNQDFYSSENTARDIEEIRKALAVDKISVYGVSYGTVPAHLYGNLFPQNARAIVLEGVVFQGGQNFMSPLRRLKLLQKFFEALPLDMQEQILRLSNGSQMPANWFSNIGMKMLYLDHSFVAFRSFLDNVLWNEELLTTLALSWQDQRPTDIEFGYGHVLMGMIGCRELGMNLASASLYAVFENRQLVYESHNSLQSQYCEPLGYVKDETAGLFNASERKSLAPITYFQGTFDGATVVNEAVQHYRSAAKGFAQLILIGKGGHLPVLGALSSGYESGRPLALRQEALDYALRGEPLPTKLMLDLEQTTGLGWKRVLKLISEQKKRVDQSF